MDRGRCSSQHNDFKQMRKKLELQVIARSNVNTTFTNRSVSSANPTVSAATCKRGGTVLNTCVGAT
jgi:hypothetical protein